jgi:hypothetical protein
MMTLPFFIALFLLRTGIVLSQTVIFRVRKVEFAVVDNKPSTADLNFAVADPNILFPDGKIRPF